MSTLFDNTSGSIIMTSKASSPWSNLSNAARSNSSTTYAKVDPLGRTIVSSKGVNVKAAGAGRSTASSGGRGGLFSDIDWNSVQEKAIGAGFNIIGNLAYGASGRRTTKGGKALNMASQVLNAVPVIGPALGAFTNILGGFINSNWGSYINEEAVDAMKTQIHNYSSDLPLITSNNQLLQEYATTGGMSAISNEDIDSEGPEATKITRDLNDQIASANSARIAHMMASANALDESQDRTMRANYAAFGGPLHTYGTDWSNGITLIGNGGTHEENPFEGVPVGVAPDGKLNLVEEGEVIFDDYVFSNRIKVPKAVREKYKLRGTKDMTFADAAKKAQKESEERPNDPISKRGLEDIMGKLTMEQEILQSKKHKRSNSNEKRKYAWGSQLFKTDFQDPITLKAPTYDWYPWLENKEPWNTQDYKLKTSFPYESNENTPSESKQSSKVNPRWGGLRYAPAIGSGLAVLTDTLGLTNKADYSNADALIAAGNNIKASQVDWNPIGNYLTYRPFDRLFYANQLGAQAAATRRAITNNSGGNRAAAIANLLAADYNAQTQLGNLYRQAEEYNLEQRAKVEDFNRGTNIANSEGMLKAAMANQDANLKAAGYNLEALMKAYQMREAARMYADKNRSENLSNFIESLGNIGRENEALNARDFFLLSGGAGPVQPGYEKLLTGNNGLLSKLRTKKSKKKNKKG
jgi:hypothetical protein